MAEFFEYSNGSRPGFLQRLWDRHHLTIIVVSLLFLFFVVLLWRSIFISIHPGEAGVLWRRFLGGTVVERAYPEGFHVIFPWDQMYIYNMRVQEISDSTNVLSKNGLVIGIRWSARFFPDGNELGKLHKNIGPDYVEKLIRPEVISAIRSVVGNYTPEDIYAKDEEGLLTEVYNVLLRNIGKSYIQIHDVLLTELRLPNDIEKAINNKLMEEQMALAYEFVLQKERSERERQVIEAEGVHLFEEISGVSALNWRGIKATETIAQSQNTKVVIVGTDSKSLPIILNADR